MFLHTFTPSPILAHLGPLIIHWYGLCLSLAALAGYFVFRRLAKAHEVPEGKIDALFFISIIAGLIGARLYHVTNEWSYYAAHPNEILAIWNGGLAIHGALIGGLIAFILYAYRNKLNVWALLDSVVPAVALGQAIGRWGNYFNQELFGRPTTLPWGIPIEPLNRPIEYLNASHFHPTFLYESLGLLAIFAVLYRFNLKSINRGKTAAGIVTLLYFILMSAIRIPSEMLRVDQVPLIFGQRLPLLVSLIIMVVAGIWLVLRLKRKAT